MGFRMGFNTDIYVNIDTFCVVDDVSTVSSPKRTTVAVALAYSAQHTCRCLGKAAHLIDTIELQ